MSVRMSREKIGVDMATHCDEDLASCGESTKLNNPVGTKPQPKKLYDL